MKRRGLIFLFLCSFLFFNFVKSEEQHFLNFPFKSSKKILQGWFYNNSSKHQGIDYYCNVGDAIYAPADGIAMSSSQDINSNYSYGNFVFINHKNGNASLFAHLDKTSPNIKNYPNNLRNNRNYSEWTEIKKGDYIGDCGMTGTNNSHLHFETTKGFYAIDRFDSYDLYTISDYYPFNNLFSKMGEKNIWVLDYLKEDKEDINNFLDEINQEDFEIKKQNYQIEFVDKEQEIVAENNLEIEIKVKIKNNGDKIEKNRLSFNVLGGLENNKKFKHDSWVTDLRPALLDKNIEKGEEIEFSFLINSPNEIGDFIFEFTVVEIGTWRTVNTGFFKINIKTREVEDILPEEDIELEQKKENLEEKNIIKKITKNIQEKTEEVIKNIKNIFIGNSTSAKTSDNSASPIEDNGEENNFDYDFSIIFPTSTIYNTSTEKINIFGTKTLDLEKIYINSSSQEILFTSTTWQKEIILEEGENLFNIYADYIDSAVELIINYQKEINLPVVNVEIDENILDFTWQSESYDFFDVEYRKNDEEWESVFSSTTSTSFSTTTSMGDNVYLRVRSKDKLDNFTDWVEVNYLLDYSREVVINEIAWMGVSSDRSSYEWIELYNNTEEDIDLNDWSLFIENSSGTTTTIDLFGEIKQNDFFLLARNSNVFKDIEADQISNFSLNNTGAKLILYNGNKMVDATDQKISWFAGEKISKYRTNERIDSSLSGDLKSNWQTNEIYHYNSESVGNVPIYGSPGQDNNSFYYIPQNYEYFYTDFWDENNTFVLTKEHNPYMFNKLDIPADHKIIIEPGVVVFGLYNDSKITVNGELESNGTEEERIFFTSRFDDIYDKEKLGFISESSPGNWKNIEVKSGGKLIANYTDFKYIAYSDSSGNNFYYNNVIKNLGGEVYLNNVKMENCSKGDLDEKDAYIYNNGILEISSSTFNDGHNFLYSESGINIKIDNNYFSDFSGDNIFYIKNNLPDSFKNNSFENSNEHAYIREVDLNSDYNFDINSKYLFLILNINSSSTVNIYPGCELKFMNNGKLNVFGNLNILGEENNPVKITGYDNFTSFWISGGNLDAKYLEIYNGGYTTVSYNFPVTSERKSYVFWLTNNANADLENTKFFNTRRPGGIIYIKDSNLNIKNSYLGWTKDYNKNSSWYDNGIKLFNSNLFLDNVDFERIDTVVDNNNSTTTYENMSVDNFSNMYCVSRKHLWIPSGLFNFNPCTVQKSSSIEVKNIQLLEEEGNNKLEEENLEESKKEEEEIEKNIDNNLNSNINSSSDKLIIEEKINQEAQDFEEIENNGDIKDDGEIDEEAQDFAPQQEEISEEIKNLAPQQGIKIFPPKDEEIKIESE